VVELSDGTFAISGETEHSGGGGADLLMIRTDVNGIYQWNRTFGGPYGEFGYAIMNDSNGFAMVGSQSNNIGTTNLLLVRLPDRAPPYWVTAPRDFTVELGEMVLYDMDAVFPGSIVRWLINDTTNFRINYEGVLRNNTALTAGVYVVTVWVTDTYEEQLSGVLRIQVQDTIAPEWIQEPYLILLSYVGGSFRYDLNASDSSGIDHWWLDSTTVFSITDEGVIENRVPLIAKDYRFRVWVNDTYGNTLSDEFTLMVREIPTTPTLPIPGFPFEVILLTLTLVLGITIFLRRRWKQNMAD
jgi:hypothetical protein